ncbi:glutaredoxin family protein [Ornithinibacillus scapharcae]|uniref:glutaredoxin family protein n=1 Tax=Ornithinibacillus scapharcae TaxID=1147159 RepID=UPI0009D931E2
MILDITVYTQTGCRFCTYLKDFLKENNIPFFEKNIAENEIYRKEFLDLDGRGVPLTIIKNDIYIGCTEDVKTGALNYRLI